MPGSPLRACYSCWDTTLTPTQKHKPTVYAQYVYQNSSKEKLKLYRDHPGDIEQIATKRLPEIFNSSKVPIHTPSES